MPFKDDEDMRDQVVRILEEVFDRYNDAKVFLTQDCGLDSDRMPPERDFQTPTFWTRSYRLFWLGTTEDGLAGLAAAAIKKLPSNGTIREFHAAVSAVRPGVPADSDTGPPTPPESPPMESPPWPSPAEPEFNTLEIYGTDNFDLLLRTVQDVDPGFEMLYTGRQQFAALVRDRRVADEVRVRLQDYPDHLDVEFAVYPTRPYLFYRLTAIGPDHQEFRLSCEPSTTLVSDIPGIVLTQYNGNPVGRSNIRTVVDLSYPGPNGRERRRLDPGHTLDEAGVEEGDTLLIYPEVVAGSPMRPELALGRARAQIRLFAKTHDDFLLLDQRPTMLPREYEIELKVPGIEMSAQGRPQVTDHHRIVIYLQGDYPDRAPGVQWLTPIFHPNVGVLPAIRGQREPERFLCLGILQEFYEPALDLGYLCQMIMDVARCRNYSLPNEMDPDTPGEFNKEAQRWFLEKPGQAMIRSIGGASAADLSRFQYGDPATRRRRSSRISRAD